jgi:NADH dehydrogenase [ubiquinone] 1 alpha subcomplex assembly factor 6
MTFSHCFQTVRKHDPDRFLLSLFARPDTREALWALYAFNYEIARTREVVTETQLGLIRLQWWRDAINAIYAGSETDANPVVVALAKAIKKHDLPQNLFETLVYAREFDLEDRQPSTLDGLVHYADFTSTPLLSLSLIVKGATKIERVREVSIGYALTGLLRALPLHLTQRRCYLPADMTPPVEDLYAGKGLEALQPAVKSIVQLARMNLSGDNDELYLDLHAHLARMYLSRIEKADYDVFSVTAQTPPFAKAARLWWRNVII